MILVNNKIIPFKGYKAVTIWPFIFVREPLNEVDLNHENIHGRLLLELLIIIFYLIYFIEWIFKGYKKISFEKEAYERQYDLDYLKHRPCYAMWFR